jgi:ABC-2 type transport system permease protein
MSKVWLIVRQHYRQEVTKRSFIIIMLSLPLFLALSGGLGYLSEHLYSKTTLGYVDEAGLLTDPLPEPDDSVNLVSFESAEAARAALDGGSIDAFYRLPADFAQSGQVEFVFIDQPPSTGPREFRDLVRVNLLSGHPPEIVERALPGPKVTVRATAYNREFPGGDPSAGLVAPLLVGAMFAFFTMTTSGFLMGVLVKEKENRTMEIMLSSVSTSRMMLGKIIAGACIGLTLLVVWGVFFAGAAWVGRSVLEIGWLQDITVNWRDLLLLLVVALPSYLVVAAAMTMIGVAVSTQQEADQVGPFLFMIMLIPLYLVLPISQSPNGPLAIGLSLFPPTSVMAFAFRSMFREVPVWQAVVSAAIGLVSGGVLVWLAGRALRVSMLRYGQRLRWSQLFGRSSGNG